MIQQEAQVYEIEKARNLVLGLLFDLIGMLSFSIPFIGEFADILWAPLSGFLMIWMYKGTSGKIAGMFSVAEEIFPFSDIIPSFTLMWIYRYIIAKK